MKKYLLVQIIKSYKHKYFLMYMKYSETKDTSTYQKSEVSKMEWGSLENCLSKIRSYNLEKKDIITRGKFVFK